MVSFLALLCVQVSVQIGDTSGLDDPTRAALEAAMSDVAASTPAPEPSGVLSVRALGGPTRVRATLEWSAPGALLAPSRSVDLLRASPEAWRAQLAAVVRAIVPEKAAAAPIVVEPVLTPQPIPAPPSPSIAPWITLGASAATLAAGVVLGLGNRSVIARGEASRDPNEIGRLQDQAFVTGLSADVCFGSAAILAVVTAVLFVRGDEP